MTPNKDNEGKVASLAQARPHLALPPAPAWSTGGAAAGAGLLSFLKQALPEAGRARPPPSLIRYTVSRMDRLPFAATESAAPYDRLHRLPVCILLDNVRSLYNVGAFFRTADAAGAGPLLLAGITGRPPKRAIAKTALGAEETVVWQYGWDPIELLAALPAPHEIAAIETSIHAVDLYDWQPRFPVCLVFGHEVEGIRPALLERCHTHVRIPMLGRKHSLNVATAGGVVLFELLRKYRRMLENQPYIS